MVDFLSSLGTRELLTVCKVVTDEGIVAVAEFTGGCCIPGIGPARAEEKEVSITIFADRSNQIKLLQLLETYSIGIRSFLSSASSEVSVSHCWPRTRDCLYVFY